MNFVDLFAGLGGFHLALQRLGHTCVFACEVDNTLRVLYEKNFDMQASADIRDVEVSEIPPHDILCAGFPCQPFSKAGYQQGLDEPDSGGLFFEILRIINYHKPPYIILENVPNFERHDGGGTWERIEQLLRIEGYDIKLNKLSPHQYGIPQIRERIYIVGSLISLDNFNWPIPLPKNTELSIRSILDTNPPDARGISENVKKCLAVWQEFLDRFPKSEKLPSFPIWSMEFGATYPYQEETPSSISLSELRRYHGTHGCTLKGKTKNELFALLPSHARTNEKRFPRWKVQFIKQNRDLYERHKEWLDNWKPKITDFHSSFQKLEWNCQGEPRVLDKFIIQVRASGVRIKRPTTSPSLVAMTATQVPIIAWEERYMTPDECKRLQSMDDLQWLPERPTKAYEALGNAVNVKIVELVADTLLKPSIGSPLVDNNSESLYTTKAFQDTTDSELPDGMMKR
ncbi:DNA (cytosine-5-)-methyltransferase [Chloroflexota bacterium]